MTPELIAQVIVALVCMAILLAMATLFSWMHTTMFPEMWKIGERCGMPPTRGEVFFCKALAAAALGIRLTILVVIAWISIMAVW